MTDFNGRTILVTGASGGIGGATVRQLKQAGADVIASGRSVKALVAVSAETGARTLASDLTSEDSVRRALEGLDLWGVVNCGGFGGEIATPMDTDISVFDQVITVNARGATERHARQEWGFDFGPAPVRSVGSTADRAAGAARYAGRGRYLSVDHGIR
jgi:NAD(P)-dependent dehydrogenase (short-subunit alcohol dehydrogenase family)